MIAIIKEPGKNPKVTPIANEIKVLQEIVEGFIQCVPYKDATMIVNEDGKLLGLKKNFPYGEDIIVGTAIFVGTEGDDFVGLKSGQIGSILSDLYLNDGIEVEE